MDSLINQLFTIPIWLLSLIVGLAILIIGLFISTRYITKQDLKESIFLATALLAIPLIATYALIVCNQNDITSAPWKYLHITRNGQNTEGELIYVVEYQDRQYDIRKTLTE